MNKKTKIKIKPHFVQGLKQYPKCLDFHITPCLTLGIADKEKIGNKGKAFGLCIEWGFWAVGISILIVYIKMIHEEIRYF